MSKPKIIDQCLETNIMREREILSKIKNDFIINMSCCFQDFSNLYLVLQLMTGGDLRYHICHYNKSFNEEMIKFVIANILFCLEIIHQNGIIHRDIKPDNFVFDESGYLHLTDFGLANYNEDENNSNTNIIIDNDKNINYIENEIVGTIGYIAPEIILGLGKYTFSVDFYGLGVICYELLFQTKPYKGATRYQIGKEMIENEINYDINSSYSHNLINLIKKLLEINPKNRLGNISGLKKIKQNEYLIDFDWDSIQNNSYPSPFIESIEYLRKYNNIDDIYELFEIRNCNSSIKLDDETNLRFSKIEASPNYIYAFQDYSFIYFEREDYNDINSLFQNKTNKKKIGRSNSVIKYVDRVVHNIQLPPIYPQLYRDAYKYKIEKYNKLLNKIEDKENEDKSSRHTNSKRKKSKNKRKEKEKEKERKKHHYHKDSHSSYDGRPYIINNYLPPSPNYNQYYPSPFQSVQNNFILPEINPFLKGFKAMNNQNDRKKFLYKSEYSKYSSSETYEKLYKNKKTKINTDKSRTNSKKEEKTKQNQTKEISKSLSKKEDKKEIKDKNPKKKEKTKENKNNEIIRKTKSGSSKSQSDSNIKTKNTKKGNKKTTKSYKESSSNNEKEESNEKGLTIIKEKSEENESSETKRKKSETKESKEENEDNSDSKEKEENEENEGNSNSNENEEDNSDEEEDD